MGRPRMIWSKAAREKLEEELDLYLDAALFITKFKRPNDVVKVASDNITAVMNDLEGLISSKSSSSSSSVNDKPQKKDDVSLIIKESRLKVENQLQYIRDNDVSHDNNKAFHDFLVDFKSKLHQQQQDPLSYDNDITGTTKLKRKASQLTQLELQQQKDDEDKLNVILDKQDAVKQFTMDFYHKTVRFMEKFVPTSGPPIKDRLLIDAFLRIADDYCYLYNIHGYHEDDKWYHLDLPQLINEYKSKLETELQLICDKVSDPAIKEAFSNHLAEVTAQSHPPHLHNKDKKRIPSKQKMSVIQNMKSSLLSRKQQRELFSLEFTPSSLGFGNHNQFCFKKNNNFDRTHNQCCCKVNSNFYRHHVKSPSKAEG